MAKTSKKTVAVTTALALGLLFAGGAYHSASSTSASVTELDDVEDAIAAVDDITAGLEDLVEKTDQVYDILNSMENTAGGESTVDESSDEQRFDAATIFSVDGVWSPVKDTAEAKKVTVKNNIRVEMKIFIESTVSGWSNVFHVGDSNGERSPALWLFPGKTNLHFRASTLNSWNDGLDSPALQLNKWYDVVFEAEVQDNTMRLIVDDVVVAENQYVTAVRDWGKELTVWRSDPWHDAANVKVRAFKIQSDIAYEHAEETVYEKPGALVPLKDTELAKVNINGMFRVSFGLTVQGTSSVWTNILHVGASNTERSPGIWLYPSSTRLTCVGSTSISWNSHLTASTSDALDIGRKYAIVWEAQPDLLTLFIDGVLVAEYKQKFTITPRLDAPLYASDPWYETANVVIDDLKIVTWDTESAAAAL